ncbi:MAG TPA: type II secretion system protein [Gaiellaceae bacterium]|nr:type II secretion system protein [Gaiellaceae bacterium]
MAPARDERGFMMLELLMAMTVMAIALTAMIVVFTSAIFSTRRASQTTTAAILADAQMEAYRGMTSRDIGLDLSAGTVSALDSNYKNDPACANSTTGKTCATDGVATTETGPTGTSPHSCTTINAWYSNTLPCTPSRTVSGSTSPASPDGRSYRIDTYIVQLAATGGATPQRAQKQVTVVVRDSAALGTYLARETTVIDCSTGQTPNSSDC